MYNGGDAAEQIVRLSLEGFEVAVKLTGKGAKELAILLASVLKQELSQSSKTSGKSRLTNMIKSGKNLDVFSIQQKDLKKFTEHAKQYGILYCVLKDKNSKAPEAMVDIIVREEDSARIQRIVERFELSKVDKASVMSEKEKAATEHKAFSKNNSDKTKGEIIAEEAMGMSTPKESKSSENPSTARMDKSPLSEQSSEQVDTHTDKGLVVRANKRPSVKEKLERYKEATRQQKEAEHIELTQSGNKTKILESASETIHQHLKKKDISKGR